MARNFPELWQELKDEARAILSALKKDIADLEQRIVPVIEADVALVLGQLKTLAINAVIEVAKDAGLSGQEKFGAAVARVFQAAEAEGKAIAIQDVQMLVQQAYNAVSTLLHPQNPQAATAETPPAPPAPAAQEPATAGAGA